MFEWNDSNGRLRIGRYQESLDSKNSFLTVFDTPVRPNRWIQFNAWLKNGIVVWLQSGDGELHCTIAKRNSLGELQCPVYWGSNVGFCILKQGGEVGGSSCYIKKWKLAFPLKLV